MINTTAKLLILSILWYSKSTSLPKLYLNITVRSFKIRQSPVPV